VFDGPGSATSTFSGGVELLANLTVNADGANDNNVNFAATIDADNAATQNRTLTVTAGAGTVTFGDLVGNNQPLADLDVTAATIRRLLADTGFVEATAITAPHEEYSHELLCIRHNAGEEHGQESILYLAAQRGSQYEWEEHVPMSERAGVTADVGKPFADGVQDAIASINEKGGINGKKIELINVDYAYKIPQANAAYKKFVAKVIAKQK
jgi:hypothetical protein